MGDMGKGDFWGICIAYVLTPLVKKRCSGFRRRCSKYQKSIIFPRLLSVSEI